MADKHQEAQDLADKGLDTIIDGDSKKGEAMVKKARALDPEAVSEIEREVEKEAKQAKRYANLLKAQSQSEDDEPKSE